RDSCTGQRKDPLHHFHPGRRRQRRRTRQSKRGARKETDRNDPQRDLRAGQNREYRGKIRETKLPAAGSLQLARGRIPAISETNEDNADGGTLSALFFYI